VVYGANQRAGQLGENGPLRPFYNCRAHLVIVCLPLNTFEMEEMEARHDPHGHGGEALLQTDGTIAGRGEARQLQLRKHKHKPPRQVSCKIV
jgi:hypothetical protein